MKRFVPFIAALALLAAASFPLAGRSLRTPGADPSRQSSCLLPSGGNVLAGQDTTVMRSIILEDPGENKMQVTKILTKYLQIVLKDAYALVGDAPVCIKEEIPEEEALRLKEELEKAGARVSVVKH